MSLGYNYGNTKFSAKMNGSNACDHVCVCLFGSESTRQIVLLFLIAGTTTGSLSRWLAVKT